MTEITKGEPVTLQPQTTVPEALAVSTLVADPPLPYVEGSLRYGLPIPLELGLRFNEDQVRGELYTRVPFPRWHAVIGVGYQHKWYLASPLDLTALTTLGPLQRDDADLTFLTGQTWGLFTLCLGLKGMYSTLHGAGLSALVSTVIPSNIVGANLIRGHAQSFVPGALAEIRVGPPWAQLLLELDLARSIYSAAAFGTHYDLGALLVVPTIGVVFTRP